MGCGGWLVLSWCRGAPLCAALCARAQSTDSLQGRAAQTPRKPNKPRVYTSARWGHGPLQHILCAMSAPFEGMRGMCAQCAPRVIRRPLIVRRVTRSHPRLNRANRHEEFHGPPHSAAALRHSSARRASSAFTAGASVSAADRSQCAAASLSSAAERGPAAQTPHPPLSTKARMALADASFGTARKTLAESALSPSSLHHSGLATSSHSSSFLQHVEGACRGLCPALRSHRLALPGLEEPLRGLHDVPRAGEREFGRALLRINAEHSLQEADHGPRCSGTTLPDVRPRGCSTSCGHRRDHF